MIRSRPRRGWTHEERKKELAAIMFTDIVGYAALSQADEANAMRLLEAHNLLLKPIIQRYMGKIVKTLGDRFLIEFGSALEAGEAAIEIQKALRNRNRVNRGNEVSVRIGIHIGDIIHREGDICGDAVNVASRTEPLAEPGGICVSEQVSAHLALVGGSSAPRMPSRTELDSQTQRI